MESPLFSAGSLIYLENSGSVAPRAVDFHISWWMAAIKAIDDGLFSKN